MNPGIPNHTLIVFVLAACILGCGGSQTVTVNRSSEKLPDLMIKKIVYHALGSAQRTRTQSSALVISYEFTIDVGNVGNADFAREFSVSITTGRDDYNLERYSTTIPLNETRLPFHPGQVRTFQIHADVEYPRPPIPTFLSMRFYLDTGEFLTPADRAAMQSLEQNLRNNVYELSMQTIRRL